MMCFHFLCQRLQRVNPPETVLESFPYNDNLSPKSTRHFGPGKTLPNILCRPPKELKLVGLITCIMFHKIC